jgi:hypothetical protein
MSEHRDEFIGNGTLLEVLLSNYIKPFRQYDGGKPSVRLTTEQHSSLKEIQRYLHNDAVTVSGGVEAIGHFIARADFDSKGVDDRSIESIGYLVEHLGRQLLMHTYQADSIAYDLSCVVISD